MILKVVTRAAALGLVLGLALSPAIVSTDAEAKVTRVWEHTNKDKCYRVKKVPATVEYDTRGKLKHPAKRVWVGDSSKHGSKVIDRHVDAVYFQTRRVIEEQHTTLVPTSC
ncbi:MAG: hypothetical protein AAGA88_10550 [Pseudomonadota bacterium]